MDTQDEAFADHRSGKRVSAQTKLNSLTLSELDVLKKDLSGMLGLTDLLMQVKEYNDGSSRT